MPHRVCLFIVWMLAACATVVAPVRAELPAGLKFDDGFTWVECHNFQSTEDNVSVGRWVPEVNLRILGTVPDRSGFKLVVKKDGKPLAEYLNDGFPAVLAGKNVGLCIVGWWKDTGKLTVDGPLEFDVFYIDGKTDQEHLARTLKVDVRRVETNRGGVGSREPGPAWFYVNRHAEILSTLVFFRDVEFPSYTGVNGLTYYSDRVVELVLNYSENENFDGPTIGRIRLEVDGKPVELKVPQNDMLQDELSRGEQAGKYNVEHSDRNAKRYFDSGPPYKERVGFARRAMILPIHWGPKPSGNRPPAKVYANDHPSDWKITWIIDRKPVRVWRFKVGPDGLPVPHAEQQAGLTLLPNAILADTEIPGEGGVFDGRLTPEFVKAGAFFGRPWSTDAMKVAAEKVPTKGTPFPIPSKLEQ